MKITKEQLVSLGWHALMLAGGTGLVYILQQIPQLGSLGIYQGPAVAACTFLINIVNKFISNL
jgi:hypothetical protein